MMLWPAYKQTSHQNRTQQDNDNTRTDFDEVFCHFRQLTQDQVEDTSCSVQPAATTEQVQLSRGESHTVADITSLLNASSDVDNPRVNEQPVTDRVRRTTFDLLSSELQGYRSNSHIGAGKTDKFRDIHDYISSVSKDNDRSNLCGILKLTVPFKGGKDTTKQVAQDMEASPKILRAMVMEDKAESHESNHGICCIAGENVYVCPTI